MTTIAFVQARLGSTRLPGKVLEPLAGRAALERIVERTVAAAGVDGVVVLTPDGPSDEPLRRFCAERGIDHLAGPEHDVLGRFHAALAVRPCERVVRITADCPLVDPEVVGRVVALHERSGADHAAVATGALPPAPGLRRFPDGLDAEVVTAEALELAWAEASDPYEREHVTPFIWRRPERFRLVRLEAEEDLGDERWTIDHPQDLEFVRSVYARLAPAGVFGYRDVLALLRREPDLRVNAALRLH